MIDWEILEALGASCAGWLVGTAIVFAVWRWEMRRP